MGNSYSNPLPRGEGTTPSKPQDDPFGSKRPQDDRTPRLSVDDDESLLDDPDMMNFDDGMKQRTEKVLGSLEEGMKSGTLELSSLKDVTSDLLAMNEDVVKFILNCELDVWANAEMKQLVTEYFDHSLQALDFCGVLEKSVQHARDNQMIIESAISHMPPDRDPNENECRQILEELNNFVRAENPFSTEFAGLFVQVYTRQKQLQVKLSEKKKKINKRERNVHMLRKVTTVILTATCVSLVICAAVAMAVAGPIFNGTTVSEGATLPFEAMHGWLRNLWSRYEQRIKAEREVIDAAEWGTWVAIKDLDTINSEVRRLNGEIEGIIRNIHFGQERGDSLAVQQSVRVIKRKQEQFTQQLEDLNHHVNACVRRINRARAIVLERILGRPDRS